MGICFSHVHEYGCDRFASPILHILNTLLTKLTAIAYSLIAPLILGVAALCLSLVYLTYKYNLLYIYSSSPDSRGIFYPRALKQTLTGVYLAEICLVGLFGLKGAFGPLVITFGLVIFTTLIHVSLNQALSPLLFNLPRTLAVEEELRRAGNPPFLAANLVDQNEHLSSTEAEASKLEDGDTNTGYDSDFDPSSNTPDVNHGAQNTRLSPISAPEGTDRVVNMSLQKLRSMVKSRYKSSALASLIASMDFWSYWITPSPLIQKPNFILKFLHPEVFADYHILRDMIPQEVKDVEVQYEEGVLRDAYSPPSMRVRSPRLWLPRDGLGISAQEVRHCGMVVECTDEEAWVNERGQTRAELEGGTEAWVTPAWERVRF